SPLHFLRYFPLWFRFFFQAEDGIRDRNVTGVQTCALPISGFVEGLVVPAAGVRDHAGLVVARGTAAVAAAAPGVLLGGRAAGGEGQGSGAGQGERTRDALQDRKSVV